ncbi:PP2C family serine/threonine-protein phosphatase (plasmid) [Deinococcus radiomollis]|uniref:PP2C family serine/threonine-protein phosphatase n=1 Tax=Deinococcus radiomollis TaxID=468916 RepID=UPI003892B560
MTDAAWRYVYTSVRGTGHLETDLPCQDASLVHQAINSADEPLLVLLASDGAGSAVHSEEGSQLVCAEALKILEYRFTSVDFRPGDDFGAEVVHQLRGLLTTRAEELGCSLRDLACTLTVAVLLPQWAWFLQIGDGAIIVQPSTGEPFEVVFWPDNGEYANQTYFLTDVPDGHVHSRLAERSFERVSLITDGLQTLALLLAERCAHPPFFLPMFGTVEAAPDRGEAAHRSLVPALTRFLDSGPINARTNDDKTLVLASRVRPAVILGLPEDIGLLVTETLPPETSDSPQENEAGVPQGAAPVVEAELA